MSEVLSECVSSWAPFSCCLQPFQCRCWGLPLGKWARKQPTPVADLHGGGQLEDLGNLGHLPQRPAGRGLGWGGQWLDWLRSKMVHCLLVGSLASWGTAMGTSNSLDWKQKLLQKFFTAAIY